MIPSRIGPDEDPVNERERDFVQLAMRLYQADAEGTLAALTRHAINELEPLKAKMVPECSPAEAANPAAKAAAPADRDFESGSIAADAFTAETEEQSAADQPAPKAKAKAAPKPSPQADQAQAKAEAPAAPPWGETDPRRTVPFQLRLPEDVHVRLAWYGTAMIPGGCSMQKLMLRAACELIERLSEEYAEEKP